MRRRDFLATSTLIGSLAGCLRLTEGETDPNATASETRNRPVEDGPGEPPPTETDAETTTEGDADETETEDDDEPVSVSGSWTAFGNGPSNAGLAASAAGVEEYEVLWTRELSMESVAGPILADGTLYTHGDGLAALDAATGEVRWTVPIMGGRATPTYVGDGVVTGNSDRVALVDLDGDVRWQASSGGDGHAVTDDRIYTSGQGNVWAFDLAGELVWDERTDKRTTAVPAVADGTLCVATRDGLVYGFDADTGDRNWTFEVAAHTGRDDPAGFDVTGGVTIYDGTAYFGTWDRTVYAVTLETGELEWSRETNGGIDVCPAAADGTIYVGNDGGRILALDAATGTRKWESRRLGAPLGRGIALSDDTAYAVSEEGLLAAVNRSDGTTRWRHLMSNGRVRGSPAVADGMVFMTDGAGVVHAIAEQ